MLWTFVFTSSHLMEIIYRTPRDHSVQQSHKGPSHTRSLTVMCSLTLLCSRVFNQHCRLGGPLQLPMVDQRLLSVWLAKQPLILPPISGIDIYFCVGYTMRIIFPWTFLPLHASAYYDKSTFQSCIDMAFTLAEKRLLYLYIKIYLYCSNGLPYVGISCKRDCYTYFN